MTLFVDGGCSGNSQLNLALRRMVMVVTNDQGEVISERWRDGGSNNIAELEAVRDALAWCQAEGHHIVEIRTDSRNNLAWILGTRVGKSINDRASVLALRQEIEALRRVIHLTLTWVPRHVNLAGHYIEERAGL